jgi:hypothetical protein
LNEREKAKLAKDKKANLVEKGVTASIVTIASDIQVSVKITERQKRSRMSMECPQMENIHDTEIVWEKFVKSRDEGLHAYALSVESNQTNMPGWCNFKIVEDKLTKLKQVVMLP